MSKVVDFPGLNFAKVEVTLEIVRQSKIYEVTIPCQRQELRGAMTGHRARLWRKGLWYEGRILVIRPVREGC